MLHDAHSRRIEVIAYSGYKANERPMYFFVDHQKKEVKQSLDRRYGQDHNYFKVLADDGCEYRLKWHRASDMWYCEQKRAFSD